MGKITMLYAVAIAVIFLLQNATGLDLDSFLVDTLDGTMLALEKDRATKDLTKLVTVPKTTISYRKKSKAGGGWSSSRRRRYSVRKMVKKQKKKIPLNKNLQAINQIQNGMLEANAMRSSVSVDRLEQHIKHACNAKQFIFARQMVGHNILNQGKGKGRERRSVNSPSDVLAKIKNEIGDKKFSQLMAYDGGVTLAFAVDTTGSMYNDIDQAKIIVQGISSYERTFLVDYVLSPFNDPITHKYHGPLTYMNDTQKYQFLELVKNLTHNGGGDCDELAITGIKEIFAAPLQYQSPIYVFTDAGAKDATKENIETLKEMIYGYAAPVNFFLSTKGCLKKKDIDLYTSLADYSGGQVLYFANKNRIGLTLNLIKKGLIGGSRIPVIPNKRKRRGLGGKQFSILVDDSVETLTTTVLDQSNGNVKLYSPAGALQLEGKILTGGGALYVVNRPTSGIWKLVSSSNSYVTAKCVSLENIDFEYIFLVQVKVGLRQKVISSKEPIQGKEATVMITVPAHAKTIPSSYKLQVVDVDMNTLRTVSLRQHGKAGGRYKGSFLAPNREFRIILEGKTKRNRSFKRLAAGVIKPKSAVVHVFSAPRGFVVTAGGSPTPVLFALHTYGVRDIFEVKADESKKFIMRLPRRVYGFPGRMSLFSISFKAPSGSKRGRSHNVVITVIGKRSKVKSRKHIQLLVV